jgi:hypothetical protein
MVFYENLSTYDFINKKYNFEDYMEAFTTAMGILFFVYMLLIAQTEPFILLTIMFGLIFSFLVIIEKKYKQKYNIKLDDIKSQIGLIKNKLHDNAPATIQTVPPTETIYPIEEETGAEEEEGVEENEEVKHDIIESISPYNFEKMENMLGIF